jgi:hypothetical protein
MDQPLVEQLCVLLDRLHLQHQIRQQQLMARMPNQTYHLLAPQVKVSKLGAMMEKLLHSCDPKIHKTKFIGMCKKTT